MSDKKRVVFKLDERSYERMPPPPPAQSELAAPAGSAKLAAITLARQRISAALVEQTMGLRDDVNEAVERILDELYEAGRSSSPNAAISDSRREKP